MSEQPSQTDVETSANIAKIAAALARAQAAIAPAQKDASNPHFNSRYADLAAILDVCRGPLAEHGIAVVQAPSADGKRVRVRTLLLHESGEWIAATLTLTAADERPQAIGSAITYGRRYGLQSMLRIAAEDDDGEASEGRGRPARAESIRPPRRQAQAETPPPAEAPKTKSWRDRIAEATDDQVLRELTAQIVSHKTLPQDKREELLRMIDEKEAAASRARRAASKT